MSLFVPVFQLVEKRFMAPVQKVSLIDFLRNPENAASPAVELNLERSREIESRPLDFCCHSFSIQIS
jgi:hypothetical protein